MAVAWVLASRRARPPAPTANPAIDAAPVGVGVALIVLVGALAPWWAVALAAGAGAGRRHRPAADGARRAGAGLALWAGGTRPPAARRIAVVVGVTFNVFAWAELDEFLGATAIVAVAVAVLLFVTGSVQRSRPCGGCLGAAGSVSRRAPASPSAGLRLRSGAVPPRPRRRPERRRAGRRQLENGDFDGAERSFREASATLAPAHERLTGPLAAARRSYPSSPSTDRRRDMSGVGAAGAATVADALDEIDLDALRPSTGASTSTRWAPCSEPLTPCRARFDELQRTADDVHGRRGSSTGPRRARRLRRSVDEHLPGLDNALAAIRMARGCSVPTARHLPGAVHHAVGVAGPRRVRRQLRRARRSTTGCLSLSEFGRAQDLDAAAFEAGPGCTATTSSSLQYGASGSTATAPASSGTRRSATWR